MTYHDMQGRSPQQIADSEDFACYNLLAFAVTCAGLGVVWLIETYF